MTRNFSYFSRLHKANLDIEFSFSSRDGEDVVIDELTAQLPSGEMVDMAHLPIAEFDDIEFTAQSVANTNAYEAYQDYLESAGDAWHDAACDREDD